jgi:hypothetical protein
MLAIIMTLHRNVEALIEELSSAQPL